MDIPSHVAGILTRYGPDKARAAADALRERWSQFEPGAMDGIKAAQREQQQTLGIPVPVLTAVAKEVAKVARKRVEDFVPLVELLWDDYGREGRVVATIPLGKMELSSPETILPLARRLCRSCITWEDADRLAMYAAEPIVRKDPATWLPALEPWLADDSKWVRRAGITVVARLPMKHPDWTARCLELTERLLRDDDRDVMKAVSFSIRLATRGDAELVREFLERRVPPSDPAATWVLCDAIRSMTGKLLPLFKPALPRYELWASDPSLDAKELRSVKSAVKKLRDLP